AHPPPPSPTHIVWTRGILREGASDPTRIFRRSPARRCGSRASDRPPDSTMKRPQGVLPCGQHPARPVQGRGPGRAQQLGERGGRSGVWGWWWLAEGEREGEDDGSARSLLIATGEEAPKALYPAADGIRGVPVSAGRSCSQIVRMRATLRSTVRTTQPIISAIS